MKLFRFNQIGQDFLGKRMVYITINSADAPEDSKKAPSYTPNQEQSEIQKAATRLEVKDILSAAGEDQSSETIANRIKTIRDLRRSGDITTLNRNIMSWYGNHPRYRTYIAGAGGTVNPGVVNQIRTDELAQMRAQLQQERQLEMDDIMQQQAPPNFAFALAHMTGGGGPANRLSTETQALLGEIHLNAPNSATQFLELTHEREALQNRLDIANAELVNAEGNLESHNANLSILAEEKGKFDSWMGGIIGKVLPFLGIAGGVSTLGGIGAVIGTSLTFKTLGIGLASALGGTGIVAGIATFFRKPKELLQQGLHWWRGRAQRADVKNRENNPEVRQRRLALQRAEARLTAMRTENAGKLAVLQRQYNDYKQAKIDATTETERDRMDQRMQSLATMMTLYRISEGDYAKRITAPGPVTNDFVVQQLQAMGIRGVDDETDPESDLVRLAQADDLNHVKNRQTTLQTIGLGDDIMKEVYSLNNQESKRLRNFLKNPNTVVTPLLTTDFRRKAVRMVAVVDALHALPDNNAWRESFRLAILKEMDGKEGAIAHSSLMAVLKDLESSNGDMVKQIRRNPDILVNHAKNANKGLSKKKQPYQNIPFEANPGEHMESWSERIGTKGIACMTKVLEDVSHLSLNKSGEFVDELGPVRKRINAAFIKVKATPDTLKIADLLDDNPGPVLTSAGEFFLNKTGEVYEIPSVTPSNFLKAIEKISDPKLLIKIAQLVEQIPTGAYEKDGKMCSIENDFKSSDKAFDKLEKEVQDYILRNPNDLRTINSSLPVHPVTSLRDYKLLLDAKERTALLNAYEKIKDPKNKYILNENSDGFELDNLKTARDVFNNLGTISGGSEAITALNDKTVVNVQEILKKASPLVLKGSVEFKLPAVGSKVDGGSSDKKDFVSRITKFAETNPDEMPQLARLLTGIQKRCKFDGGVFKSR
jgi:hypothetical protein